MPRLFLPLAPLIALFLVASARAQDQVFTLDDVLAPRVRLAPVADGTVSWLADGQSYLLRKGDKTVMVDAITGQESPPTPDARPAPAAPPPGRRRRATVPPTDTSALDGLTGTNKSLSPDGKWAALVRDGNLFVVELASKKERQLTTDGDGKTILNGRLDWVYEEEVYGRGTTTGYTWSPDSKHLAFLRLDERPVKPFAILDHLPRQQNIEQEQYPLPGDPNPVATLATVSVSGGRPQFVDTSRFVDPDRLIVRFAYSPDSSRLIYQLQNRIQSQLDVMSADAASGKDGRLLIHEEEKNGWIDVTSDPTWLDDGTFLWTSERTGYRHLYRYKLDGTLVNAVTKGNWDVRDILRIDQTAGTIHFDSNAQNVTDRHCYRARLDGTGEIVALTQGPGTHVVEFAPSGRFFFDRFSSVDTPGEVRVCDADTGKVLRVASRSALPEAARTYRLGTAKLVTFTTRDGYPLEGTLLLPPGYTPGQKVAIYCPVYAGPSAPTARNAWSAVSGSVSEQFFAQNGIAVWKCDNRSANPRGTKAKCITYKNLGAAELRDIEDGLKFLTDQGIADPARLAIEGWSYGGFMTEYALTHSSFFKVGVAGAGPADWHLYDTIYTERYMSTPQLNPDGYKTSSNVQAAGALSGKLLIVHGMMDDNVHVQNSVQFLHALQKAGKDFSMMLYPSTSSRHGIGDPSQSQHLRRLMTRFVIDNL
jgi:dipeptidyl aminopeptidase/acylaminoacyl peptidase